MTGKPAVKSSYTSAPLKPKKERPPHPTGSAVQHSAQFVTTLQFCNSFSEPLEIEAVSTEDFDSALTKFPDDILSQMHMVTTQTSPPYPLRMFVCKSCQLTK